MQKFTFDLKLAAAITVDAPDAQTAQRWLMEALDRADTNFGAYPNGDPILGEVSLNGAEHITLAMIDGEDVPADGMHGSLLEFQETPSDPVQAARLAVEALKLARDCLRVAKSPKALERAAHALSSAKGAVRAAEHRRDRIAEGRANG